MTFASRLQSAMDAKALNRSQLAKLVGVDRSAVSRWLAGTNTPTQVTLHELCNTLDVPPAYLLYGDESMNLAQSFTLDDGSISIPLLDVRASCGDGAIVDCDSQFLKLIQVSSAFVSRFLQGINKTALNIINVTGDSMSPTFSNGDHVIIDTSTNYFSTDGIYCIVVNGAVMIKRLQMTHFGIRVISDNRAYDPYDVSKEELQIVGRVIVSWQLRAHG